MMRLRYLNKLTSNQKQSKNKGVSFYDNSDGLVIINCRGKLGLLSHLKGLQIKTKCRK
jgi:hypothetical protein